jgi:hypothetical protein
MRWVISASAAVALTISSAATALAQPQVPVQSVDGFPVYAIDVGGAYQSTLGAQGQQARDRSQVELWTIDGRDVNCMRISMSSREFAPSIVLMQGTPQTLRSATPENQIVATDANTAGRNTAQVTASGSGRGSLGQVTLVASSASADMHAGEYLLTLRRC